MYVQAMCLSDRELSFRLSDLGLAQKPLAPSQTSRDCASFPPRARTFRPICSCTQSRGSRLGRGSDRVVVRSVSSRATFPRWFQESPAVPPALEPTLWDFFGLFVFWPSTLFDRMAPELEATAKGPHRRGFISCPETIL